MTSPINPTSSQPPPLHGKILAIASAGGHWLQLCKIIEPSHDLPIAYVTTLDGLEPPTPNAKSNLVADCNRDQLFRLVICTGQMLKIFIRERPDFVVTTGAMPGLVAIIIARIFGVRTLWIDSVANSEELSGSGKIARKFAHDCLSQWEHVAESEGVSFAGRIL